MKRSHFLSMSLLAGVGAVLPVCAAPAAPDALAAWCRDFRAVSSLKGGVLQVAADIPFGKLSSGLGSLARICDSSVRAQGNVLEGKCGDRPFRLVLS